MFSKKFFGQNMNRAARKFLIAFIITVLVCECISRYHIYNSFQTNFFRPGRVIYSFYPELLPLPGRLDSSQINILILGGSAVAENFCQLKKRIENEKEISGRKVHVFNLARIAHNSFDSKIKFKYLKHLGFDYVFVYDGINDTRTNNCPDDVFKEDYSHIHFYSQVNIFERHSEINYFTLPFLLDYYWNELKIKTGWKKIIPKEYLVMNEKIMPPELVAQADTPGTEGFKARKIIKRYQDKIMYKYGGNEHDGFVFVTVDTLWWREGKKIKSAKSFNNNLFYIYQTKPATTKLILTEYAWYQPEGYSLTKFLYEKMDYSEQHFPTEMYGKPEYVVQGLVTHNKIIDSFAKSNTDIVYFNFNDSIPHNGIYFNDICHLADSGQALLSSLIINKIKKH